MNEQLNERIKLYNKAFDNLNVTLELYKTQMYECALAMSIYMENLQRALNDE